MAVSAVMVRPGSVSSSRPIFCNPGGNRGPASSRRASSTTNRVSCPFACKSSRQLHSASLLANFSGVTYTRRHVGRSVHLRDTRRLRRRLAELRMRRHVEIVHQMTHLVLNQRQRGEHTTVTPTTTAEAGNTVARGHVRAVPSSARAPSAPRELLADALLVPKRRVAEHHQVTGPSSSASRSVSRGRARKAAAATTTLRRCRAALGDRDAVPVSAESSSNPLPPPPFGTTPPAIAAS